MQAEEEGTRTFGSQMPQFRADRLYQRCDGRLPSCRKCLESRGVVECTYRETETVRPEPPTELPLVPRVISHNVSVPPPIVKPLQFGVDPVLDPFNWAPVSLAILDFFNPPNYPLSSISPEDMNLRL